MYIEGYEPSKTLAPESSRLILSPISFLNAYMYSRGFESHPRQLIFSRKSDCLGCAVLLCLVFVFFFLLISHLKTYIYIYIYMCFYEK